MIKADEAIEFACDHFPRGPEALAAHLGVRVFVCPLKGREGWCIRVDDQAIIRVNSLLSPARQRFTLAHELGHFILGTDHIIHKSMADYFRGNNKSEEMANKVASELLLPKKVVIDHIPSSPVDPHALNRLAETANVSKVVTAIRIAGMPEHLGLISAVVLGFRDGRATWCPIKAFPGVKKLGERAWEKLRQSKNRIFRDKDDALDVVAFRLGGKSQAIFLQRLTPQASNQKTFSELKHEAENFLYEHHQQFRNSLEGCLSTFRTRAETQRMPLEDALATFIKNYRDRWDLEFRERLFSLQGEAYLRMRLSQWYPP